MRGCVQCMHIGAYDDEPATVDAMHRFMEEQGYVLYYTSQCPFNAKYVPVLEETAERNGIFFKAIKIENMEDAKNAPSPITTYALFCEGEYVTNEQMNDKKFLELVGRG